MQSDLLLPLQFFAGASLFWSAFCRLSKTGPHTYKDVRLAVWAQSVASLLVMAAPYLPMVDKDFTWQPLTTPTWVWISLLATSACIQIVTSRHWVGGVPRSYLKPEFRPLRRGSDQPAFGETQ